MNFAPQAYFNRTSETGGAGLARFDAGAGMDAPLSTDALPRETIERFVARIEVRKNQLVIHLRSGENDIQGIQSNHGPDPAEHRAVTARIVSVPWKKPSRPARKDLLPANTPEHRAWPMKAERRSALIRSIGRGRHWLQEIIDGPRDDRKLCHPPTLQHAWSWKSKVKVMADLPSGTIPVVRPRGVT
jgi:hypothetical protein